VASAMAFRPTLIFIGGDSFSAFLARLFCR
jgi:hypothetical protein